MITGVLIFSALTVLLGEACLRNGDLDGAREAVRRTLDLEPGTTTTCKDLKPPDQQK